MSRPEDTPPEPPPPTTPVPLVNSADLKLPSFWHNDPALWFILVEAEFAKRHISSQQTKYYHLITSLPPNVMAEVRDIVVNPPASAPYDSLKEHLIRRLSEPRQQRLRQLLSTEELGDHTPTQFLRRMYQLLGDDSSALDESILRELFLQRLPSTVRMILSASPSVPLRELSELADRIMEAAPPLVSAVPVASTQPSASLPPSPPAPDCSATYSALRDEVRQLTSLVQNMAAYPAFPRHDFQRRADSERYSARTSTFPRRARSTFSDRMRSPSPRFRSSPQRREPYQLCWYHARFGRSATKCEEPCIFQGNAGPGN